MVFNHEWVLQDVGVDLYHHPLEDADAYKSHLKESGEADPELERRLAEIDGGIEQNDFRAANVRASFSSRRLSLANDRKEFFFANPSEVRDVLVEKVGSLLEFVERADATEYLQSVNSWPAPREDARR